MIKSFEFSSVFLPYNVKVTNFKIHSLCLGTWAVGRYLCPRLSGFGNEEGLKVIVTQITTSFEVDLTKIIDL